MSIEKMIRHWQDGSDKNFDDMIAIFGAQRYDWALYVGHLCLEKLFKALLIRRTENITVPFTHNLVKLALKCGVELTEQQASTLNKINSFCIEAKYADDKREFYLKCTREFADEQIKIIKEQRKWIMNELAKN